MKRSYWVAVVILVFAWSGTASAQSTEKKTGQAQPTAAMTERPSYSIFQGTIVDMTWPEVKKAAEANELVLMPIAVIEEHGPHMGLGADTYQSWLISKELRDRLKAKNIEAVILPPIYWGVMQPNETGSYPGSLPVRPETMKAIILDVMGDIKGWGFQNVFIVSPHGDRVHRKTVDEAIAEGEKNLGIDIFEFRKEGNGKQHPKITGYPEGVKGFEPDYHAGAPETAIMNTYFPGEVKANVAKELKPQSTFAPLGYVGDPASYTQVNAKAYEAMVEYFADNIVNWLENKKRVDSGAH